jgi:hypothetical protein
VQKLLNFCKSELKAVFLHYDKKWAKKGCSQKTKFTMKTMSLEGRWF